MRRRSAVRKPSARGSGSTASTWRLPPSRLPPRTRVLARRSAPDAAGRGSLEKHATMALNRLYTVPEAAEALNMTEAAVRRWIWQRRLTVVKLGSAVRIEEAELARFIRQGVSRRGRPFEHHGRGEGGPVRVTKGRGPRGSRTRHGVRSSDGGATRRPWRVACARGRSWSVGPARSGGPVELGLGRGDVSACDPRVAC